MEKDGRKVPLFLERNSLRAEAHVLERASRLGYVAAGTAVMDELMDGVDIRESQAGRASKSCIPGCVNWKPQFTGRRTCSFDGCANSSQEEEGRGESGNEEEGVGGGCRTGDAKDPLWSSSTLRSGTRSSHGRPLAACAEV